MEHFGHIIHSRYSLGIQKMANKQVLIPEILSLDSDIRTPLQIFDKFPIKTQNAGVF